MIKHVFFDLDNTLWDHRANAKLTLEQLFDLHNIGQNYSLRFEDFHKEYFTINENLWAQIRDGEIDKDHLRKHRFYDTFLFFGVDNMELAQKFEDGFLDQIIEFNVLVAGAKELLIYLRSKGYTLHILSNGFMEVTNRKCIESGIDRFFTTIISADEINVRKPQREIFEYAVQRANADPEQSVFIGDDWIADIEGALAFGMRAVFFDVFNDGFTAPNVNSVHKLSEIQKLL